MFAYKKPSQTRESELARKLHNTGEMPTVWGQQTMTRLPLAPIWAAVGSLALVACLPSSPKPMGPAENGGMPMTETADMAEATIDRTTEITAREYFDKIVRDSLRSTCGGCHEREGGVGPAFLKSSSPDRYDPYVTITTWNNFVVLDPDLSALLRKGSHEGPALAGVETKTDQWALVRQWLGLEATEALRNRFTPFKPQIRPFYPAVDGTYTKRDLGEISPLFAEAYITFKATKLARGIELSDIRFFNFKSGAALTNKEQRTIHFVRPLFVVWKNGRPLPDPVDNFAPLEKSLRLFADDDDKDGKVRDSRTVANTGAGTIMLPGLITLTDWGAGDALSVVFNTFELLPAIPGENPCTPTGLGIFRNIAPYLAKSYTPGNCATRAGCHTSTDSAGSLDLSPALTPGSAGAEPEAFKKLCERIKFYNTTGGMVDNVDPVVNRHQQFKYNSTNCAAASFPATCHADFKNLITSMRAMDP